MGKFKDDWLKRQQQLHVSDVAEEFISVTDIKQYIYCQRIVYFDRVLHATPMFGSQQKDSKELHEDYVEKELRRKDAIYYSRNPPCRETTDPKHTPPQSDFCS